MSLLFEVDGCKTYQDLCLQYNNELKQCKDYKELCEVLNRQVEVKQSIYKSLWLQRESNTIDNVLLGNKQEEEKKKEPVIEDEDTILKDKREHERLKKAKQRLYKKTYKDITGLDDYSGHNLNHKKLVEEYLNKNNK